MAECALVDEQMSVDSIAYLWWDREEGRVFPIIETVRTASQADIPVLRDLPLRVHGDWSPKGSNTCCL